VATGIFFAQSITFQSEPLSRWTLNLSSVDAVMRLPLVVVMLFCP
jgi:hypothetical protein